jgi:L-cysteine S-thiosulfotransferase
MIKQAVATITCLALFGVNGFAQSNHEEVPKKGRALFMDKAKGNCIGCHSVQNDPMPQTGNLGPHLANMDMYPKEYLIEKITDPNKTNPQTIMPPQGRNHKISKEEILAIVAYLRTTAKSNSGEQK